MPSPTQVHVDAPLSDFASAYKNGEYFADQVSPIRLADKRSGKYYTYSRRDTEKRTADRLSPQGGANEVDYTQSTANYSVEDRGLNFALPADVERNADAPLTPEQDGTEFVMNALMLEREIRVATTVLTNTNYASGNYATMGNYWTNKTSGTPLADINTGLAALAPINNAKTLFVCAREVWNALRTHPDFLSLRGSSSAPNGQISRKEFAEYLEVDDILVSDAYYDSANPGQSVSRSRVWTATKAALVRVPASVSGAHVQAFSMTFREKPGVAVRTWPDPDRGKGGSLIVRVEFSDDEVVVQNDSAYLFEGVRA